MQYLAKRLRIHSVKHPGIYIANLLLSFHYALLLYINSSFLETLIDKRMVGIVFGTSAFLSILMLLMIPRILRHVSNADLMLTLAFLQFFVVAGLAFSQTALAAAFFFVIYEVFVYMMYYGLDISLESVSEDRVTGSVRTVFLTFANFMFVLAPLLISFLVVDDYYLPAYLASSLLIIPFFILIWISLRKLRIAGFREHRIMTSIRSFARNKNLRNVIKAQFLLNLFFSWMVIYMPIYLHEYVGFSWQEIGVIFSIMLLPFVLFEIPIGRIADKILGEKEIMITGFIIMSIFTFFIPALPLAGVPIWAFALFMTRVGASFVEATTESYFWKHVDATKTDYISFFRIARPLGYGVGPLLGTITLWFLPYEYLFTVLSFIIFLGVIFAFRLKDTR